MSNEISEVKLGSIAEEVEIEAGDKLLKINGKEVKDIIDYRFLTSDDYLEIELEKADGEIWDLEIEKEYDEELGIVFKEEILDKARSCKNKCIFCFIDQLPKGMRDTLYFKDDDSRLSFLQGNFVTLTNMSDEEIDRIIAYRISPINISVHTTNPELRVKMLTNKNAGKVYERMTRMAEAGIHMETQIVLVPGVNDGKELERTLEDLYKLHQAIGNVAVVPIGVTKYREGLFAVDTFGKEGASNAIDSIESFQKKCIEEIGEPFVRMSDEFYIVAERELPTSEFYGSFAQLEDGVGMMRMYNDSIDNTLEHLNKEKAGRFTFITGALPHSYIEKSVNKIMAQNPKVKIDIAKIENDYFGRTITVTGLLTGTDIVNQLSQRDVGEYIILPDNVLRKGYELGGNGEQVLLDDYTVKDIEEKLDRKVIIVDFTGADLITKINDVLK